MKKKVLAVMLAGALAVTSMTGCTSNENTNTVDPAEAEPTEAEAQKDPEPTEEPEEQVNAFKGLWVRNKTQDSWLEIGDDSWCLINYLGDEADGGKLEINGDKADLYDKDGDLFITVSISGADTLFDETYQEDYSAVDALPDFTAVIDLAPICGDWIYEQVDSSNLTDFESLAYVHVSEDGTFNVIWFDEEEGENTGNITSGVDTFEDGDELPFYKFMIAGNNLWIAGYCDQEDPDIFWIGNGGMERLVRLEGQGSVDFSGKYSEPPTGRSLIEIINEDGIHYSITVVWANTANESVNWKISDAVYGESSGVLEYTDAECFVRTFTDELNCVDEILYNDGSGRFWIDEDGNLNWVSDNSDVDHITGATVFEKLPE